MKRKRAIIVLVVIATVGAAYMALTSILPLSYAEYTMPQDAIDHVKLLQQAHSVSASECAQRYVYFGSDYATTSPVSLQITSDKLPDGTARVTLYNPRCQDDSEYESIDRIYLRRQDGGTWVPVKHEWSHKGRGRWGWTTEPTL